MKDMALIEEIQASQEEFTRVRRDIHAHPELAYRETRTSDLVARLLESWGIEVHKGLGKTGVVGVLRGNRGSSSRRAIGIRADMDALPMPEHNRFEHVSTIEGRMHGCGHDGHTAILLAAAKYLAAHPDFDGVVNFIFQPAEEDGAGAKAMMADGLFERFPCDEIYGLHNRPAFPVGHFGFRKGVAMASASEFKVTIRGVGGHAAMPQKTVDPVIIAAEMICALQTVVSRHKNPDESVVLSVTQIHAGDAFNVIPNEAVFGGTVRTFNMQALDEVQGHMQRIVETLPKMHGGSAEMYFDRGYPALSNWDAQTDFAADVAEKVFGKEKVHRDFPRRSGGEDFAYYLQQVPGCYLFLGNGDGQHLSYHYEGMGPCEVHNPNYDFNDALLPIGATYWVCLVEAFFKRAVSQG